MDQVSLLSQGEMPLPVARAVHMLRVQKWHLRCGTKHIGVKYLFPTMFNAVCPRAILVGVLPEHTRFKNPTYSVKPSAQAPLHKTTPKLAHPRQDPTCRQWVMTQGRLPQIRSVMRVRQHHTSD